MHDKVFDVIQVCIDTMTRKTHTAQRGFMEPGLGSQEKLVSCLLTNYRQVTSERKKKSGRLFRFVWCLKRQRPTLRSQVVLRRRLEGFRSRCSTLAEWMYLSPRRIWQRKQQMWSLLRCWVFRSLQRSVSMRSWTMYLHRPRLKTLNMSGFVETKCFSTGKKQREQISTKTP